MTEQSRRRTWHTTAKPSLPGIARIQFFPAGIRSADRAAGRAHYLPALRWRPAAPCVPARPPFSCKIEKALPPQTWGRKATLPRYHPHSRIAVPCAHSSPVTAGKPSRSRGPLPGEPRDTHQGGFQPVTAPLCHAQAPYFPVLHISLSLLYHNKG